MVVQITEEMLKEVGTSGMLGEIAFKKVYPDYWVVWGKKTGLACDNTDEDIFYVMGTEEDVDFNNINSPIQVTFICLGTI